MADAPAFIYLFPPSCIHPCPSEHSRMPWPTDLHLFIYFRTGAFIRVQVSIPECHGQLTCIYLFCFRTGAFICVQVSIPKCHGRRTGIYLFISGQVHASNPRQAFPSAKADGPVFIYIFPTSCMHTISDHHSTVLEPLYRYIFPVI